MEYDMGVPWDITYEVGAMDIGETDVGGGVVEVVVDVEVTLLVVVEVDGGIVEVGVVVFVGVGL